MPKKLTGRTFCDFSTSILSQKLRKKSLAMPKKKLKIGTLWSRPVMYVTREKKENLVQFDTIKFCRTCRTFLVTSGVLKNTDEKPRLSSTLFSRKAPTKNDMVCPVPYMVPTDNYQPCWEVQGMLQMVTRRRTPILT